MSCFFVEIISGDNIDVEVKEPHIQMLEGVRLRFVSEESVEMEIDFENLHNTLEKRQAVDNVTFEWFCRTRSNNIPLSGTLIREKVLEIDKELSLSDGFCWLANRISCFNNIVAVCVFPGSVLGSHLATHSWCVKLHNRRWPRRKSLPLKMDGPCTAARCATSPPFSGISWNVQQLEN
uniref:Uncharacterized protein n=1 Tax=Timema poppense TaxID=170557 RepID=A0A7R9H7G8_TIMPO|nr:unnamed protein product [Timema poppensis]